MDKNDFSNNMPDSLFRYMLKRNFPMLLMIFFISILVSLFLRYQVLDDEFVTVTYVKLQKENEVIPGESILHQQFIRVLKNNKTRAVIISKHKLLNHYNLNSNYEYYPIQLDKCLYDDLKVEEQSNGCILLSFVGSDIDESKLLLTDLLNTALITINQENKVSLQLKFMNHNDRFEIRHVFPEMFSIVLLVTLPVLLVCIIFIAIKEKLFLNLELDVE